MFDAIKRRLGKATPSPWNIMGSALPSPGARCVYSETKRKHSDSYDVCTVLEECDAEFIANAPSDIASLLTAYESEKNRADANRDMAVMLDKNSAGKDKSYAKELAQITADRDHWKKRATVLQKWVHELQSGMYINCVYCGHNYGPADEVSATMADALKGHIEKCPAHPMSALRQSFDELVDRVKDAAPCWACRHEESCEGNNSLGCCTGEFEYAEARFAPK